MGTPKLQLISAMVSWIQYCIFESNSSLDPREFSISTKEFVLDEGGKLKGLNTGAYFHGHLAAIRLSYDHVSPR